MNDQPNDATKPDEPLTESMPDPAGPPQPVKKEDAVLRALSVAGVVVVAAGGLLLAMAPTIGATQGATRSTKIQWEQRQAEIRRAMSEDQALAPPDGKSDGSGAGAGDRGGR